VDRESFVRPGARLAQGDLVRAPSGIFAGAGSLASPSLLDASGPPLEAGDLRGIAVTIPRLRVNQRDVVLRAWYQPCVVVSPDCAIDKNPPQVLLAPILPLSALPDNQRDGVRSGTYLTALGLPADDALEFADGSVAPFPESYVDLQRIAPVAPDLIAAQRMVALSEVQTERLRAAWVRFVALREISSTGTIAAAQGKRVAKIRVVESSRKRHTVLITFEDSSMVVLYQEPRRTGPQLQEIRLREGQFSPQTVAAQVESDVVLRFENDDPQAWRISSSDHTLDKRRLEAGTTTDILIRCPGSPGEIVVTNVDRPDRTLRIEVQPATPD
jgi:hypothetical protein